MKRRKTKTQKTFLKGTALGNSNSVLKSWKDKGEKRKKGKQKKKPEGEERRKRRHLLKHGEAW